MTHLTLSRAIEGYLLYQTARGRSPNTIRNYRGELARFLAWVGDSQIDQITPQGIDQFMRYLWEEFRITHVGSTSISPRPLSRKSLRNAWAALSHFWKWTSGEFQLNNPFHVGAVTASTRPILGLTKEQTDQILKSCSVAKKRKGPIEYYPRRPTARRDRAIVLTLLDTGMRVSELCGVDIGDLDLETGRIMVSGKGSKRRFVYVGRLCRQAIWRYLTDRFPSTAADKSQPLFVGRDGVSRMARQGVLLLTRRLGARVGIDGVHPHKFRHTFAVEFLRNGGNVFELQQLLGHSDLAMVRQYVRLADRDLAAIALRASPVDHWRFHFRA